MFRHGTYIGQVITDPGEACTFSPYVRGSDNLDDKFDEMDALIIQILELIKEGRIEPVDK